MTQQHIEVGIVAERRRIDSPWADHAWAPLAVLPEPPALAPWTVLARNARPPQRLSRPGRADAALGRHRPFPRELPGRPRQALGRDPPDRHRAGARDRRRHRRSVRGRGLFARMSTISSRPCRCPSRSPLQVLAFFDTHHVEREFVKRQRAEFDPRKGGGPRSGPPGARGGRGPVSASDDEDGGFLSRWSRRKRELAEQDRRAEPPLAPCRRLPARCGRGAAGPTPEPEMVEPPSLDLDRQGFRRRPLAEAERAGELEARRAAPRLGGRSRHRATISTPPATMRSTGTRPAARRAMGR